MTKLKQRLRVVYQTVCVRLRKKTYFFPLVSIIVFGVIYSFLSQYSSIFGAPTQTPGVGSGAIGVDTATNNLSIGTATPAADSKLLIVSPSTGASDFALKILQLTTNNPILVVRSDGSIAIGTNTFSSGAALSVNGNIYSSGSFTGTVSAGNISSGVFGNNISGSPFNYAFPGSLGVGVPSQVGLGAKLQVCATPTCAGGNTIEVGNDVFINDIDTANTVGLQGAITSAEAGLQFGSGGATIYGKSGNVGIGTTAPVHKLQILDTTTNTNVLDLKHFRNTTQGDYVGLTFSGTTDIAVGGIKSLRDDANTTFSLVLQATDFGGSLADIMTLQGNGNVGIGTTAPQNKLTVLQSSGGTGYGGTDGLGGVRVAWSTGYGMSMDAWDGDTPRWGIVKFSSNTPTVMMEGIYNNNNVVFNSGGNVGIGTTNPTAKLTIGGTAGVDGIKFPDGTLQTTAAGAGASLWAASGANINNTNSGNVGIGTAAPVSTLEVSKTANNAPTNITSGWLTLRNGGTTAGDTTGIAFKNSWETDVRKTAIYSAFIGDYSRGDLHFALNSAADNSNVVPGTDTKMIIKYSGNVGIGTVSPGYKLDVVGGSVRVAGTAAWENGFYSQSIGGNVATLRIAAVGAYAATEAGFVGTDTNIPFVIRANGQPVTTFLTNGNVGIGTTAPTQKLDVNGNINGQTIGATQYCLNPSGGCVTSWPSGQWLNGSSNAIYYNSGNVGIGTMSPGALLTVQGTDASTGLNPGTSLARTSLINTSAYGTQYDITFAASTADADSTYGAITGLVTGSGSGGQIGDLLFSTKPATLTASLSERMRITSGGNVGIGLTTPGQKLEVAGNVSSTGLCLGGTCNATWPSGGLAGGGTVNYVGKFTGSGTIGNSLIFDNGTNVGIGTATPSQKLEVVGGGILISNDNSYLGRNSGGTAVQLLRLTDLNQVVLGTPSVTLGSMDLYGGTRITFAIAGSEKMRIANTGNVGIGTTGPISTLNVYKDYTFSSVSELYSQNPFPGQLILGDNTQRLYLGAFWSGGVYSGSAIQSSDYFSSADHGQTLLLNPNGGNVGIGTTAPTYKLDVVSAGGTTARFGTASTDGIVVGGGAGKITVGTVDPLYSIGGAQYATYLPGMTGQKEETTGNVKCKMEDGKCEYVIDFKNAEKGSDSWLFYETTDFGKNWENLTALLTPNFDGRAWYEKNAAAMTLTIYGVPNSQVLNPNFLSEISYRLTAPRFDAAEWPNVSNEQGGLTVPLK